MPDGATTPDTAESAAPVLRGGAGEKRWPLAARLVLIFGGAALLWGGIFALVRAVL